MNPPFDPQPTLTGARLVVRPLHPDDYDGLFAAASDPKIWEQHPEPDRYTETVFRQYFSGALASGSAFAFVDRDTGELVGSSRFHDPDPAKGEIEIGWTFLVRRCWGGDWNREAKRLMLAHAFRWFDTVVFWVGEDNRRSRRAMQKTGGMLREGVHTRSMSGAARYVVFEIRKADWLRLHGNAAGTPRAASA